MSLESDLKGKITFDAWKKIGIRKHHGINILLSSIHTEKSCGVGEFFDLLPLIDWCKEIGMDVIQLLPLNISGRDPSPYNALSSCALHPLYLSLHALPYLEGMESELEALRLFNTSKHVLYHVVYKEKLSFLSAYIKKVKEKLKSEPEYKDFIAKQDWLPSFALFLVLKDEYDYTNWQHWPEEVRHPSSAQLKKLYAKYERQVEYYSLIQYLCFHQFKKVKAYAESKEVFLKGDVPILVCPDSADVWMNKAYFDFNHIAGSPPNQFDPEGQYWGFPLYNWIALEQNHFEWWKTRLLTAQELYHIYRIDHIVGFFRLWAIPPNQPPSKGAFLPEDPAIMSAQGRKILDTLTGFTDMLPIGEDLGKPIPFLRDCLRDYGIPGLKIFRWQRNGEAFIPCKDYPPVSMTTVSTHDIDTVRLWWQKKPKNAVAYAAFKGWTYEKDLTPERQFEILHDSHHSGSLFHINLLQEYLALVPELTWEDPEDERINYPGTMQPRNWAYRYKLPLEKLTSNPTLKDRMKKLLEV